MDKLGLCMDTYERWGFEGLIELCKLIYVGCNWIGDEVVCYFPKEESGGFYRDIKVKFHRNDEIYSIEYGFNSEDHVYEDFNWVCY